MADTERERECASDKVLEKPKRDRDPMNRLVKR